MNKSLLQSTITWELSCCLSLCPQCGHVCVTGSEVKTAVVYSMQRVSHLKIDFCLGCPVVGLCKTNVKWFKGEETENSYKPIPVRTLSCTECGSILSLDLSFIMRVQLEPLLLDTSPNVLQVLKETRAAISSILWIGEFTGRGGRKGSQARNGTDVQPRGHVNLFKIGRASCRERV